MNMVITITLESLKREPRYFSRVESYGQHLTHYFRKFVIITAESASSERKTPFTKKKKNEQRNTQHKIFENTSIRHTISSPDTLLLLSITIIRIFIVIAIRILFVSIECCSYCLSSAYTNCLQDLHIHYAPEATVIPK